MRGTRTVSASFSSTFRVWEHEKHKGNQTMQAAVDAVTSGVTGALVELRQLGRARSGADILASFDSPGTSSGRTEAINRRRKHLSLSTLGFATSRTTSRDGYSKSEDSDQRYTLNYEEPVRLLH